ncbi:YidB family protein [Moraxella porci]|uniref:YidB family protein n=1 Tax=Moraxella porci TaxID=1288392 RepID=UPI00244C7158|nr:YidB family protein [Moraxella porci]MDH2272763.1 YidB family protein [Moraxella porci]
MSLLQNIVGQVLKNAIQTQPTQQPSANQSGLGGLLGGLANSMGQSQQPSSANQAGLGGLLGSVLGSQMGGRQSSGLESVLGGLLGNSRQNTSAGDLGSVLGSVLDQGGMARGGLPQQSGGFNKSTLLLALLPVVLAYIQKNGGLSGVLGKFSNNGMGNKAQSWVNIDVDNDGIDAGDIQRLFGDQEIQAACAQTGASESEVCQGIAELLPKVVNDLTPQGDLSTEQEANDEIAQILAQMNANKL